MCGCSFEIQNGEVLQVAEGICEGSICFDERGKSGFGYDPIFVPDGYDQTFGELSEEIENSISHRARALQSIRQFWLARLGSLDRANVRSYYDAPAARDFLESFRFSGRSTAW